MADLKRRLDSMGPVNLDAIEEFDELEERHTFTKNQHDDLVNSKAKLLEIIERINIESERLFAETFRPLPRTSKECSNVSSVIRRRQISFFRTRMTRLSAVSR